MTNDIDFKAIYKDLDRQELREKLVKQILLWILSIAIMAFILAIFLGYIHLPIGDGRCHYVKDLGDVCIP